MTSASRFPLGATPTGDGVHFRLFSEHATAVELCLFRGADDGVPSRTIGLEPSGDSAHVWHAFVPGVEPGELYGYRVDGPFEPDRGNRFDAKKLLLDPYARGVVVPASYSRQAARGSADTTATAMKGVIVYPLAYDWEGDRPLGRPSSETIVYELHLRGFTRSPSSGVPETTRGTYRGLIDKIPYLVDLGITAVELLPVFQFDKEDAPPGRVNHWGYSPVSFFAPHQAYGSRRDPLGPIDEFRDMIKALHRAGIECILDVVFNHTAEGNHNGPTLGLRGIDNAIYYILAADRARYADFTGTGNTLNANHPVVRALIVDSLRYWVEHMHVDGFRFDLASILCRDHSGKPMPNPPVLQDIESDPVLVGTKLIAEAWDAAGLYQVGRFGGKRWKEWNGQFRDDVRDFLRAAPGSTVRVADRLFGSGMVYAPQEREAETSVNFATCHDGFTLNDLVSYERKHNDENGEGNRDGSDDNRSWNCGIEGPTDDAAILQLRNRQIKNFLAITILSVGMPMILMGDEARRTQLGNNNAYCHDDEKTWFDWKLTSEHADIHRFVKLLNERWPIGDCRPSTLTELLHEANPVWHGTKLDRPDWRDDSHSVAVGVELRRARMRLQVLLNAHWEAVDFELPRPGDSWGAWRRRIDTFLASPDDIVDWQSAPVHGAETYRAAARSLVVLFSELGT